MGLRAGILFIATLLGLLSSCETDNKSDESCMYVLSVGIDDYNREDLDKLSKAKSDAREFGRVMKKHAKKVVCLLEKEASHDRIMAEMQKLYSECEAKDVAGFYFSGHGREDGIYCCDTDTPVVTFQEIKSIFRQSKAKRKLLFIDACNSGSIIEDTDNTDNTDTDVVLFLSSRADESSQENSGDKNSIFTKYLLKGLVGKSDANRDSIITASELFYYVHSQVLKASGKKTAQHPVMWGRFDENMTILDWRNK